MMRDAQRIDHMPDFVRRSLAIVDGVDEGAYKVSRDKQELLELNMLHLGEAAAHVSDELKEKHPEIPWHEMIGIRNIIVHEYFRINPMILYETATSEFAALASHLETVQAEMPL
jgi:uncharacterized protein with HEPN domain